MAIIKSKEIREMDDKTITTKLFELRSELVSLNAQVAMGTAPENPGKIGEIKRTIARILTIQKQKEGENKV
ncbi:50S ribosomal protein L29 [Candidatus Woesearchaeota archaeon]|jgi:large subunit ribosomal protein L29|nr:50S ribosomal protein L29 [Candidatus Woesearchaeota archaeon]MBT7238061.1 50S ribosomal protein L29 [Candidatus Woesearchaeota archaeon]